eukprot:scaffold161_cov172-Amphora_coffeaeformis.AAC.7
MSDLAPFVASVLRDKTVQDLYDENLHLRAWREANRYDIEITGPHGAPTYAACDLSGKWGDRFQGTPKLNFVHTLLDMEIHMRGLSSPVFTLRDAAASSDWKLYMAPNRNNIVYLLTKKECEDKYLVSGLQLELHYVNHRQLETLFAVFNNTNANSKQSSNNPQNRLPDDDDVFAADHWKAPSLSGYAIMKWGDFQLSPRGVAHIQTMRPDLTLHVIPTCGNNASGLYGT